MTPDQFAQLALFFGQIVFQTLQSKFPKRYWTSTILMALEDPSLPSVDRRSRRRLSKELRTSGWPVLLEAARGERGPLESLLTRSITPSPTPEQVHALAASIEANFARSLEEVDYRSVLDLRLRLLQQSVDREVDGHAGPLIHQVGTADYCSMTGSLARFRRWRLREAAGLDEAATVASFGFAGRNIDVLDELEQGTALFVTAPIGTGKSDVLLNWLARSADRAATDASSPLPVLLRGDEVTGSLEEAVLRNVRVRDLRQRGANIVLDGLDEAGSRAESLAERSIEFVNRWPKSRLAASSRSSETPRGAKSVALQPWPLADAQSLIAAIVAPAPAPNVEEWSAELQETVRRPLFAILAAQSPAGATAYNMIDALVKRSIGGRSDVAHRDLAIAITRAEGPVDPRELASASAADFDAARLVNTDQQQWRFELPIFQQWFAAQGVLSGVVGIAEITSSLETFAKWRYVVAVALSGSSSSRADELLTSLATWNSGAVTWVLRETRASGLNAGDPLSESVETIAQRLVGALEALNLPDEPLTNGRMNASAVSVAVVVSADGRAAVQWSPRSADGAAIVPFRPHEEPFGGRLWEVTRSGPAHMPGIWPWHWTLDSLATEVEAMLMQPHLLVSAESVIATEFCHRAWAALNGGRSNGNVDAIDRVLNPDGNEIPIRLTYDGLDIDERTIRTLDAKRDGWSHHGPWAGPDLAVPTTGWIGGNYSDEQLRLRTHQVYEGALTAYCELSEGPFAAFGDTLAHRARLPGSFVGHVKPGGAYGPSLVHYLLPNLDRSTGVWASRVNIGVVQNDDRLPTSAEVATLERAYAERRRRDPDTRMMLTQSYTHSILQIFGPRPATKIAIDWLWDDLSAVGRVESLRGDFR